MSEYIITIDGFESGLTGNALVKMFKDEYPECEVTVEREE